MHKKSLIIGINSYQHFPALENCRNDAEDMHAFLSDIGFQSILAVDSTQAELIKIIAEFKDAITENTVSLIFFSGHGLQDEKYNFLAVSDSEVRIVEDIKYNCISADDLLIKDKKTNLHFIILDACRNNPFHTGVKGMTQGLLKMNAPAGTLIAFSTSPHSTSIERAGERNGVYTKYLLRNMLIPNIPAELVFKSTRNDVMKDTSEKQIPWEESSLFGDDFCFIKQEQTSIEDLACELLLKDRNILLPELMPFLTLTFFESASLEKLILLLTLLKIGLTDEQEDITSRTIDEDYLNDLLFEKFYLVFQERLIKEDDSTEPFSIEIFEKVALTKNINYGYNWLDSPEESFPQMVINFITIDETIGILCLFLTIKNDEHILKPVIITINNNQMQLESYAIITGDKVHEVTDFYFKMREPFEKKVPDFESSMTITQIDEEELKRLFKQKK